MAFLNKISRPSPRAVWLYIGGFACLALTALMNRHAGVSQGATEEGRQLLGAAAIVIDIVGIVVFGSVAGNLFHAGKKGLATAVLTVMIGCALFSITSIMSFVASEWLSVAESRKAATEATKNRQQADLQAAKERREAQERLAQSGLGMMQSQLKEATKKERKVLGKDFAKGASELVAELGKEQTAKPVETSTGEVAIRPDGGAEVMSWMMSVPERTVQVTRIAALAVLLIVLKAFAFPLGAYYWSRESANAAVVEAPPPQLPEVPDAIKLEAAPPKLALPKPSVVTSRPEPAPEWRALLDLVDFPRKRGMGALRPRDKREVLGWRFMVYLCAHNLTGEFTADQLDRAYEDYCAADYREPWATRIVKAELRDIKKWVTVKDSQTPTLWIIASPPIARLRELLAKRRVTVEPIKKAPEQTEDSGRVVRPPAGFFRASSAMAHNFPELVRQTKAAWQGRVANRKQLMSRSKRAS